MNPAQPDIDMSVDAIPVPFTTKIYTRNGAQRPYHTVFSWAETPARNAMRGRSDAYFGCRESGRTVGIYSLENDLFEVFSIARRDEGWRVAGGTKADIHTTFMAAVLDMFDQAAERKIDITQARTQFLARCDTLRNGLKDGSLRIGGLNREIIVEDISSPSPILAINRPVSALYRTSRPIFKSRDFLRTKMSYLVAGRHSFKVEISRSGDSLRTLPFGRRKPLYAKSLAEMHYKVMKSLAGADIPGASGHDRLAIAETARQLKIAPPDFSYPLDPQPPEQEF